MPERYEVKGSNIVTKFEFIEEEFGPEERQRFEDLFKDKDLFPLFPAGWYPYEAYISLLETIALEFFKGDQTRLEALGRYSARRAFGSTYDSFLQEAGFEVFLNRLPALHRMFYSFGRLKVSVLDEKKQCEIVYQEVPAFHEIDLHVGSGFFVEAAKMHGIDKINCSFRKDAHSARFDLTWE